MHLRSRPFRQGGRGLPRRFEVGSLFLAPHAKMPAGPNFKLKPWCPFLSPTVALLRPGPVSDRTAVAAPAAEPRAIPQLRALGTVAAGGTEVGSWAQRRRGCGCLAAGPCSHEAAAVGDNTAKKGCGCAGPCSHGKKGCGCPGPCSHALTCGCVGACSC